jgi:hypothetical protein
MSDDKKSLSKQIAEENLALLKALNKELDKEPNPEVEYTGLNTLIENAKSSPLSLEKIEAAAALVASKQGEPDLYFEAPKIVPNFLEHAEAEFDDRAELSYTAPQTGFYQVGRAKTQLKLDHSRGYTFDEMIDVAYEQGKQDALDDVWKKLPSKKSILAYLKWLKSTSDSDAEAWLKSTCDTIERELFGDK